MQSMGFPMCFPIETARFGRSIEMAASSGESSDSKNMPMLIAGMGRGAVAKICGSQPTFVFCLRGELQLHGSSQSCVIAEDQFYVNIDSDIRISSIGDAQWLALYFPEGDSPYLIGDAARRQSPLFTSIEEFDGNTRRICTEILARPHAEKCAVASAEALLDMVASYSAICLQRQWSSPGRNEKAQRMSLQRLLKVRTKITTDAGSITTIQQLAAQANYSEWHFIRVFHRVFGETPMEYANRLRLKRAKHMLETSRMTVSEIARDSGYETFSAFCRSFRHHFGMTASSLRMKAAAH